MKTIRTETIGKATLRLVETGKSYTGIVIAGGKRQSQIAGTDADEVWNQLRGEVGKASAAYFGFEGARSRFLKLFPDGFQSEHFTAEERDYKVAAKAKLDQSVPLEQAATGSGHGLAILRAYQATNLLSPFEKTRLQPLLRGSDADAFVQAAARFALGETKLALATMERLLTAHDNAKWTVVTYLPYLWRPDTHMFLKPTVTKDYAERIGHPLAHDYAGSLDIDVYESLLDLTAQTRAAFADLHPRDNIDLQSLIWVIGAHPEAD